MGRRYLHSFGNRFETVRTFDAPYSFVSSSYGSDEFNELSASLTDKGWTLWNPGNNIASGTVEGRLCKLEAINNGGVYGGFYKNIPTEITNSFSVAVKIVGNVGDSTYTNINGIFIGENLDASPTTAGFHSAEVFGDTLAFRVAGRSAYNDNIANYSQNSETDSKIVATQSYYLRLRVSGTTCWSDYSTNGKYWNNFDSRTLTISIVTMGIFSSFQASLAPFNLRMYYSWFRVIPTHDFHANVSNW